MQFSIFEDRDEVLYSGPHMMYIKPIIVKAWLDGFDLSKEVLQTIPLWVKFPNFPLSCWGVQSLSRISSGIGVPYMLIHIHRKLIEFLMRRF